ncbi:hypothetical protein VDG1235_3886 [Verrucomicrobiia bacterium DG1235]|nr:hypothetical protein VDG1235_3886 [Verrucomicrobiae bacterium DG1235]
MRLPKYDWPKLERIAGTVVKACLDDLPDEIRDQAGKVTCLYRHYHPNAPHVDPEAMYMLGEYISYGEDSGSIDESGVIALYLGAIAWYCEDEDFVFEDEVQTTFLHELGHHFGWDEEEVEERGL